MTILNTRPYFPLVGSGRLHLKKGRPFAVSYRTIVNVSDMTGGGIVAGKSLLLQRAAEERVAVLEIGPKRYIGLAIGHENGGKAPVAVLGTVISVSPSNQLEGK